MTKTNYEELRRLAEATNVSMFGKISWHSSNNECFNEMIVEDVEFIAAASPDVILALLDELDRMRAELEPQCPTCGDGDGIIMYGLGRGDPHFRECETCGNPKGNSLP